MHLFKRLMVTLAAGLLACGSAVADDPVAGDQKSTIRFILPYPAGDSTDIHHQGQLDPEGMTE